MYSFDIVFNRYKRISPILQDISALYINDVCILAKNGKYGSFYISKYVHKLIGKFSYIAGSHNYPVLIPQKHRVIIKVRNFNKYPILELDEYVNYLSIENIVEENNKS